MMDMITAALAKIKDKNHTFKDQKKKEKEQPNESFKEVLEKELEKNNCWTCHWYWLGRCQNLGSDNYGNDVSTSDTQPRNCDKFVTKEDWEKIYHPMARERAMNLLNAMIDHLSVAERNNDVIEKLLNIGFTDEELIHEFNFCEDDVKDVVEELANSEE